MNMFDPSRDAKSLTDMSVPEDQSRLQAKTLSKALESNDLATKDDISRLEFKMSEMKFMIITWQIASTGLILAAIKF